MCLTGAILSDHFEQHKSFPKQGAPSPVPNIIYFLLMTANFRLAELAYVAGGKVRLKIGACVSKIGTKTEVGVFKASRCDDTLMFLGQKLVDLRHFHEVEGVEPETTSKFLA